MNQTNNTGSKMANLKAKFANDIKAAGDTKNGVSWLRTDRMMNGIAPPRFASARFFKLSGNWGSPRRHICLILSYRAAHQPESENLLFNHKPLNVGCNLI